MLPTGIVYTIVSIYCTHDVSCIQRKILKEEYQKE